MLKILHTADWHLGKRLERFSRLEEQAAVLEEICDIADREAVDAVIIAGDIFDTFNPASEAEDLFYRTVKRLARDGARAVVVIAGNHDSPDRIKAPVPLAQECGIILAGYPDSEIPVFTLPDGLAVTRSAPGFVELNLPKKKTPLRILLTPYANEKRLRTCLGFEDAEAELREQLAAFWKSLADTYCDKKGVNMLAAHLFMAQREGPLPEESDDERSVLHVGGAQTIYTDAIPSQMQYVALGHLHRKQTISESPCPVVYSSSPLAYSMSEASQRKYVVLLNASAGKAVKIKPIELTAGRKLFRQKFEDVEVAVKWLEDHPDSLVEITMVSDTFLTAEIRKKLNDAHNGIVAIIPEIRKAASADSADQPQIDLKKDIEALFADFFLQRHQQAPSEEMQALFKEILAEDGRKGD